MRISKSLEAAGKELLFGRTFNIFRHAHIKKNHDDPIKFIIFFSLYNKFRFLILKINIQEIKV